MPTKCLVLTARLKIRRQCSICIRASIHLHLPELTLGIDRDVDLHVVASREKKHNAQDTICLLKRIMRESALEHDDLPEIALPQIQKEINIAERVHTYDSAKRAS